MNVEYTAGVAEVLSLITNALVPDVSRILVAEISRIDEGGTRRIHLRHKCQTRYLSRRALVRRQNWEIRRAGIAGDVGIPCAIDGNRATVIVVRPADIAGINQC